MAGLAGDDPFDFEDYSDGDEFCYDAFACDGGGGSEGEDHVGGPFAIDDSDGEEFCVSGFAFPDGDDVLVVEDHASPSSHEEPVLETLGRSFDSDGGLSMFLPQLLSALDLADHTSEEEEEEAEASAGDGGDDVGLMLSGFNLDPRPVAGGFQTLMDSDEDGEEAAGDDDMGEGGGLMLSGFDLRSPPVAGAFRMLVEDIDPDDADFLDVLAGYVGEGGGGPRRLPASRAAVEGLPEVALSEEEASRGCAICKDGIAREERAVRLPCKHFFHGECIRPWLAIRHTCPVCRYQLPTGNAEYDRRQRTTGGESVAQHGAPAQNGGAGTGTGCGATVGTEDATECSAENRLEQGAS